MSASPSDAAPPQAPLGIVHLLGWMAGIAVVLSAYRAALDSGWLEVAREGYEATRWWQLAYGLVYGTALSTLGLLLYRRFRGDTRFPVHPGHWLLVLGGLAFFIDAAGFLVAKMLITLWRAAYEYDPGWYYLQQSLAWGMALILAAVFLARLRSQWNWRLLALLISALIAVNWLTHTLVVLQIFPAVVGYQFISGAWPFYLTIWAEIVGVGICLLAVPIVLAGDRHRRDWLHWVGIAAIIVLALVEEANQIWTLLTAR